MKEIPDITVNVDLTNPGQFFACCGLLELADRLWPGAEGWFSEDGVSFQLSSDGNSLEGLIQSLSNAKLNHLDPSDPYSSPIEIGDPFDPIVIDWWTQEFFGARDLKVWAGTMESFGIARALQHALRSPKFNNSDFFNVGVVVKNPDEVTKKKEPFYFDSRRAPNAHSIDVGFSANDLAMTTFGHPAVELLCLIGLQVARPLPTAKKRIYNYYAWTTPLTASLILPASLGFIRSRNMHTFQFENWFRTGQKKHKAFRSAIPINLNGDTHDQTEGS
jgi:hypothetical protein